MTGLVTTLTPQEAADHVGCGRSSIMRALADKHLPGVRDNAGKWRIKAPDLDRWADNRPVTNQQAKGQRPVSTPVSTLDTALDALRDERDAARLEAAAACAEATQLRERMDEVRADRDRWQAMAERLVERETEHSTEPRHQPRLGFFARIFGQGRPRPV